MGGRSRVVLVTGASSGIGEAVVRELLARGHRVSGGARRKDRLEALARELAPCADRLELVPLDVTRAEECAAWVRGAAARFGRVDALVNNAGYGHMGPLDALSVEDYREQFETNFFAVVRLTQEALPHLAAHGDGDVVMISSIIGRIALPGRSAYCASKFALEGFAEAIRPELRRRGVRVSVVNPGFTRSEFGASMKAKGAVPPSALPYAMPAERVAREVARCLGRTRRNVYLTWTGRLGIALRRLAPGLLDAVTERSFRRELERTRAGS